jgi:hypothetical protein
MVLRRCFPAPFTLVAGRRLHGGEEGGRGWVEKILGWSVDLVERLRKPAPEGVLKSWAEHWQKGL